MKRIPFILILVMLSACSGILAPVKPTATATSNSVPAAVLPAAQATAVSAAATFAPTIAPETKELACEGDSRVVPMGAVRFEAVVWRDNQFVKDCHYDVVYDPSQSGYFGVKPQGWWFQPWLPGPHREYHEVNLVAKPGTNWFLGPECKVWWNNTGTDASGGKNGQLILDRSNGRVELNLTPTDGHPGESWLFIACNKSDASGFSMSLINPR